MLEHRHLGLTGNGPKEGRFDGPARHVTGVQNSALRVSAFTAEIRATVGTVFKFNAPSDEFSYAGRAGLNDMTHHFQITQTIAGREGVLDVTLKVIRLIGHAGDTALGPIRVGFRAGLLGDDCNGVTAVSQIERKTKPANATTYDNCVKMRSHRAVEIRVSQGVNKRI